MYHAQKRRGVSNEAWQVGYSDYYQVIRLGALVFEKMI